MAPNFDVIVVVIITVVVVVIAVAVVIMNKLFDSFIPNPIVYKPFC